MLTRLNSQINELTQLLALERSTTQDKEDSLANLQASLSAPKAEKSRLETIAGARRRRRRRRQPARHGADAANSTTSARSASRR